MCPPWGRVHPLFRRDEYLGHPSALSCAQPMADYILREYFLCVYLCSCESGLLLLRHFNAPGVRIKFQGAQHLATLVRFLGFSWNLVHTKDGEDFCTVKRDSFTK